MSSQDAGVRLMRAHSRALLSASSESSVRVRVTKEYLWAPDGIHVRTVHVGEELDGEGAIIALQMKAGEALEEVQTEKPAPQEPRTSAPVSDSRPAPRAFRNKGR